MEGAWLRHAPSIHYHLLGAAQSRGVMPE